MALKTKLVDLSPARDKFRSQIKLLSGGFTDRTLFKDGMITVYPWDADVSSWFVDQSHKMSGIQLTRELIAKITGLSKENTDKVVASEALLLLLVSRSLATRQQISYQCRCPHCRLVQPTETVTVPDDLERKAEKGPDYPGWEEITLPESADVVRFRPLTVGDEIAIDSRSAKHKATASDAVARVLTAIISVGGGNPDSVDELIRYYRALNPADVEFLEQSIDGASPQINNRLRHVCVGCGKEFEFELTFDSTFFRAESRR